MDPIANILLNLQLDQSTLTEPIQRISCGKRPKGLIEAVILRAGTYTAVLTNLGARLLAFQGADQVNVIVSVSEVEDIEADQAAMGASIGRVCNRIRQGELFIPGQGHYQLPINDGTHHLHGGPGGFQKCLWLMQSTSWDSTTQQAAVRMRLESKAGDQGYPGKLEVIASFTLSAEGLLQIDYESSMEIAASPVNMTHHAYWNLSGAASGHDILKHELRIPCSRYLLTDSDNIPTGTLAQVANTAFDFRQTCTIGARLPPAAKPEAPDGYDLFYVRDDADDTQRTLPLELMALLRDPQSGRSLEMWSDQPGFQLYSGNYLKNRFRAYQAVCLEPSAHIDAVHHSHFPSIMVSNGQTLRQSMAFRLLIPS